MATTTSRRRSPGRPRSGQTPLDRDVIHAAALALVDDAGLSALSMRTLARRLGVDAMSLYHHVPSKAALVSGVVTLAFETMSLPEAYGSPWDARVRRWAHAYRELALRHPHLVLQMLTDVDAVTRAEAIVDEPLHEAMRQAGLGRRDVERATGVVVDYVNGFVLAEVGDRPPGDSRPTARGLDRGLDVVIGGIRALARPTATASTRATATTATTSTRRRPR